MISDMMNKGDLTGVDISEHRMNTCRSILKKYGHNQVRIIYTDKT